MAEKAIAEALEKEPENKRLLASLGDLYLREGRFNEASSVAEQILSEEFDNQYGLIIKGDLFLKKKQYKKSVECFKNALLKGESSYIYKGLIESLMGNNQYSEAMEYCRKIITPDDFSIMKLLARCYKKLSYYKEAEELYEKLLVKYPEDEFLYKEYMEIRAIGRSQEDIINELDKILKVSSGNKNTHIRIYYGKLLQNLERYGEAITQYEKALEILSHNIFLIKQIGFCHMKANNSEKAIEIFEKSFLKYPTDYYIKTSLISLYKKTGLLKNFVKLIEDALKLHPEEKSLFGLKKKILKEIERNDYD